MINGDEKSAGMFYVWQLLHNKYLKTMISLNDFLLSVNKYFCTKFDEVRITYFPTILKIFVFSKHK